MYFTRDPFESAVRRLQGLRLDYGSTFQSSVTKSDRLGTQPPARGAHIFCELSITVAVQGGRAEGHEMLLQGAAGPGRGTAPPFLLLLQPGSDLVSFSASSKITSGNSLSTMASLREPQVQV